MKEFQGKVAVVTGAASGIGRAFAERFAEEGMKVVLADVEAQALETAEAEMEAEGAQVLSVLTDVSQSDQIQRLASKTIEAFGTVHLLCNNAGVAVSGPSWEVSEEDWAWILGVNLWGVIHGVRAFVPIMMENKQPCHIVNTASMAGLTTTPGLGPYNVTKHGVVTLSEALHHELSMVESKIKVSVLCPGWVKTNIVESDRNRPGGLYVEEELHPMAVEFRRAARQLVTEGVSRREVAQTVFEAIKEEKFYVFPTGNWKENIRTRMEDILDERPPTLTLPSDA